MKEQHILNIKNDGYTVIKNGLAIDEKNELLENIRSLEKEMSISEKDVNIEDVPYLNRGHKVIYNLQNKSIKCIKSAFNNDLVSDLMCYFLNDQWYRQIPQDKPNYIMRSMLARSGGKEDLPLHIDSFLPSSSEFYSVFQVIYLLEDFSLDNGCSVVIPGSHKSDLYADRDDWSKSIPLEAKAGDIVIWDSRLWHGALGNKTNNTRWALITTYTRWWIKQSFNITGSLPKEFLKELTPKELSILGFCSIPPEDEFDRLEIKQGYEIFNEMD